MKMGKHVLAADNREIYLNKSFLRATLAFQVCTHITLLWFLPFFPVKLFFSVQ